MVPNFVIYRIIGNSLPPRHGPDEAYDNLQFILDNEPDLRSCDKRWVLNRLVDPEVEAKCIKLIEASGQKYLLIPFDETAYKATFLDASGMPKPLNPFARDSGEVEGSLRVLAKEWILRHKSLAAIQFNSARNRAIELGRKDAIWTLPLDGSNYFTAEFWDRFVESVTQNEGALYCLLRLVRLNDNTQFDAAASLPETTG